MTICCVLCLCLFLNKVLLGLRTLCQHGRRQAAPRHIKLRSVCKASWRSDAVLMPRVGAITEIGHRMWRRQVAQAPITTIVRAVDAILIHGSMAHGELWKTQTDFSEYVFLNSNYFLNTNYIFWTRIFWTWITRFFLIENIAKQLRFVLFVLFVFKNNRFFRVLMTWLWCLSYRKARNAQKRISGKSGCCIFVASIKDNGSLTTKNLNIWNLRILTSENLRILTNVIINNLKNLISWLE